MLGLLATADALPRRRRPEYWQLQVITIKDGLPHLVQLQAGPYPTLIQAWRAAARIKRFKPGLMFVAGEAPAVLHHERPDVGA